MTTDIHTQLTVGFEYLSVLNHEAGTDQMRQAFETSLAMTAGLVETVPTT